MSDEQDLAGLNIEIGERETAGDRPYFDGLLASAFAFRRASGAVDDRAAYLAKVGPSPERATTVESVEQLGAGRALVRCTVIMAGASYDNVRLFVRSGPGAGWQLLAWANEKVE